MKLLKIYLVFLSLLFGFFTCQSQSYFIQDNGSQIRLEDGIKMTINNDHLVFSGTLHADSSTIVIQSSGDAYLQSGNNAIYRLALDQSAGSQLVLQDWLFIKDSVTFLGTDNKILMGDHSVYLGPTGGIIGYNPQNYFITNGAGQIIKGPLFSAQAFTFPVGFDAHSYNPISIADKANGGELSVRCLEHALTAGSHGTPISAGVVDASWEITEGNSGGAHLDITVQWDAADELPGFERSFTGIAYAASEGWDLTVDECTPAVGSGPFTIERTDMLATGVFAVGNEMLAKEVVLEADAFLAGPYAGSGLMNDQLRSSGALPTLEPFTSLGFSHSGFGGGQSAAPLAFTATGNNAVVDWVLVEIRSSPAAADIMATVPALLQRDGDIVDLDGSSPLIIPGIAAGNYYVVLRHRNHLGVMSAGPISLSPNSTSYDFTTDPLDTFGGGNGIADLGDGFYGLFSGDANQNGQVQNTDINTLLPLLGNSGYLQSDLNLNGQVQNTDLQLKLLPNVGKGVQFSDN